MMNIVDTGQQYDVNHIGLSQEIYVYDTTPNLRNRCQTPPSVKAQDSSIFAFVSDFPVERGGNNIVNIGKLDDLRNILPNQTLLPELPNLGSAKANFKQNSSALRKKLRDGFQVRDVSAHRLNSAPDPTPLRPDRTVGQSFLGAERLILENKRLKVNPRTGIFK